MHVIDSGSVGGDKGTLVRAVAVLATLCGVGVVALLIGLVSTSVGEKIEDLRRGKSPVVDTGHTLILGYGEKVFPILREMREANANKRHATIVILSAAAKSEVEDSIRERLGAMRTTRVVVRQGSPFSPHDLKKVGAGRAKSIIVLACADAPDLNAIKIILALRRVRGALTQNHAVVELAGRDRIPVIERLGGGGVEVVALRETLARLMVQTSRQSGLAAVYRELLRFEGAELYVKGFPQLAGRRFGEVAALVTGAVPLGIRRSSSAGGPPMIRLNPPAAFPLEAHDDLLVLAEDDDTFGIAERSEPPVAAAALRPQGARRARGPERILIVGFRSDLGLLLADFDQYCAPGSSVVLMAGDHHKLAGDLEKGRKNLRCTTAAGDPTSPAALATVVETGFDSVLLVADDELPADEADARTVIALLMLRDLFDKRGGPRPRIVSEVLDPRTKDLVSGEDQGDFVVSSEITSMLLAQVSEQRDLNNVFADLFSPDGSEIYLKPADRYVSAGQAVTWAAVQAAAASCGEVALGCYRAGAAPLLNPDQATPLSLQVGDKLIVLAEDDRE